MLPVNRIKARARGLTELQREQYVLDNRERAGKLARSILRKWHARLDLDEVQSVVDLSLCEAIKNFNPSKGAAFMTFLFYHLRGNLIRAVSCAASANGAVSAEHEDGEAGMELEACSFSSTDMAEALANSDALLPDEVCYRREMADLSQKACSKLDDLEKEVINRVFMGEQQLMDIAHSLGYSRCHISRVKKKALETLFAELKPVHGCDDSLNDILAAMEDDGAPRRKATARRGSRRRALNAEAKSEGLEAPAMRLAV